MWWFAALHDNLLAAYQRALCGPAAGRVLDAGCGTGGLLTRLATALPDMTAFGVELDPGAADRAQGKSGCPVSVGSVNALPFTGGTFVAIFSADVLCHDGVDEHGSLAQFHRCLAQGGLLVLNLPAYRWMLSRHDRAVANVRRYTRRGVVRLLAASGFRVLYASYWNALLFPVMVATRKLIPARRSGASDVSVPSPGVDAICRAAMRVEQTLTRRGMQFGFGGSLLAVAAKE